MVRSFCLLTESYHSVITSGVFQDLKGCSHVAGRIAADGCKYAQWQCFIHMQQLLFEHPPQCNWWFNRSPLSCWRGDAADVHEDAARCVFLHVMHAVNRFSQRKWCSSNICVCVRECACECVFSNISLKTVCLLFMQNQDSEIATQCDTAYRAQGLLLFPALMGNFGAQRFWLNKIVTRRLEIPSDTSYRNQWQHCWAEANLTLKNT